MYFKLKRYKFNKYKTNILTYKYILQNVVLINIYYNYKIKYEIGFFIMWYYKN